MSKLKDVLIDIQVMLSQGQSAEYISTYLNIPIEWVNDTIEDMDRDYVDVDCYYQEAKSSYR